MSIQVGELVRNSLTELGVYAPADPLRARDAEFGLSKLNRMLSSWNTRSVFIFTTRIQRFTLTPSQVSYTIGPTGADFTAPGPVGPDPGKGILWANIVLTAVSPEVHVPLAIWDAMQWANIRVNEIPVTLPVGLYNDGAHPNSTLYLWGYPTEANDLELFTRQQLSEYTAITDTFDNPPGYEKAVTENLAVELGPSFGVKISDDLRAMAAKSLAAIQSLNTAAPRIATDDGGMPRAAGGGVGFFNYRTGSPFPGGG